MPLIRPPFVSFSNQNHNKRKKWGELWSKRSKSDHIQDIFRKKLTWLPHMCPVSIWKSQKRLWHLKSLPFEEYSSESLFRQLDLTAPSYWIWRSGNVYKKSNQSRRFHRGSEEEGFRFQGEIFLMHRPSTILSPFKLISG